MSVATILQRIGTATRERGTLPVVRSCVAWGAQWVTELPLADRPTTRQFTYDGARHTYLRHRYHYTWLNERAVEVPLTAARVAEHDPTRVLEVGNVLAHYGPIRHAVVDKYERAPGVRNVDVLDATSSTPLDLVVSISTFEHIGFDEPVPDPDKPRRAVQHLASLLAPGGRLWLTIPVGYNAGLDERIRAGELGFTRLTALRRADHVNRWEQVDVDEVWIAAYDRLLFTAHGLLIGELVRPSA